MLQMTPAALVLEAVVRIVILKTVGHVAGNLVDGGEVVPRVMAEIVVEIVAGLVADAATRVVKCLMRMKMQP